MKKFLIIGTCVLMLTPFYIFAQAENCGDGNQRYDQDNTDGVVRYFDFIKNFEVVQKTEDTIVIEHNVYCGHGKDSLHDIKKIEFLDRTVSMKELVIHKETRDVLLHLLTSKVKELAEKMREKLRSAGVNPEEASPSKDNMLTQKPDTAQVRTVSTQTNPLLSQDSYASNFYRPQPYLSYANTNNPPPPTNYSYGHSNPVSNQTNPASAQSTVTLTWPLSLVGNYDVVSFSATDIQGKHYYLGSALASAGSKTLVLPNALQGESSIEIHMSAQGQLLKTFVVSLKSLGRI